MHQHTAEKNTKAVLVPRKEVYVEVNTEKTMYVFVYCEQTWKYGKIKIFFNDKQIEITCMMKLRED